MSDLASAWIGIGIMVTESLILLLGWSGVLQLKQNKRWTYLAALVSCTALSFYTNILNMNPYITLTIYVLSVFLILRVFYSNRWYVLLFCTALGIAYLKAVDNIVIYFSALCLQVAPQTIFSNPYFFIFLASLSKLVELIGAWCFSKISTKQGRKGISYWQSWVQTLPLPLAACFLLSSFMKLCFIQPNTAPLLGLLSLVFLVLCVLQLFIAKRLDHQQQSEEENRRLQQTLALRKESLQSLTEAYKVQRRLTHEFNNHLDVIASLAQQEKRQPLQSYLKELRETAQNAALVVHTGNAVMDAVLNQKYRIAAQSRIAIDFDMTNLANIPLRNEELAVVVSNLLDNSIEACTDFQGERIIYLKMKIHEEQLLLMVTNPTQKIPHRVDGHWVTSKGDSSLHGFGLSNVDSILDSFDAEYTSEYTNGMFSFVAFIPFPNPNSRESK